MITVSDFKFYFFHINIYFTLYKQNHNKRRPNIKTSKTKNHHLFHYYSSFRSKKKADSILLAHRVSGFGLSARAPNKMSRGNGVFAPREMTDTARTGPGPPPGARSPLL